MAETYGCPIEILTKTHVFKPTVPSSTVPEATVFEASTSKKKTIYIQLIPTYLYMFMIYTFFSEFKISSSELPTFTLQLDDYNKLQR